MKFGPQALFELLAHGLKLGCNIYNKTISKVNNRKTKTHFKTKKTVMPVLKILFLQF